MDYRQTKIWPPCPRLGANQFDALTAHEGQTLWSSDHVRFVLIHEHLFADEVVPCNVSGRSLAWS